MIISLITDEGKRQWKIGEVPTNQEIMYFIKQFAFKLSSNNNLPQGVSAIWYVQNHDPSTWRHLLYAFLLHLYPTVMGNSDLIWINQTTPTCTYEDKVWVP